MSKFKNKISLLIVIVMILQTIILNVNPIFAEQNGEISFYENGEENLSELETEKVQEETETSFKEENETESDIVNEIETEKASLESETQETVSEIESTTENNEDIIKDIESDSNKDDIKDFDKITEQTTEDDNLNNSIDNYYNKEENEIIIRFKDSSGKENFKKEYLKINETNNITSQSSIKVLEENIYKISDYELEIKDKIENSNIEILYINNSKDAEKIIEELKNNENILYVQKNYSLELYEHEQPENEFYGRQKNVFEKINIYEVWNELEDISAVKVAVIDTGIDAEHSELKGKITDKNNFTQNNNNNLSHGTNIAGIIAGNYDNRQVKGIAKNAEIIDIKFINDNEKGYTDDLIKAVIYAKEKGAEIINLSLGCEYYNEALLNIIKENKDILFVCAAGNGERKSVYPAEYELDNIISVAAVDENGEIKGFYGKKADVCAPGKNIYTTDIGNGYKYAEGSSMSTAIVTGIAALYKGKYKDALPEEIVKAIKISAVKDEKINNKVI